MRRLYIGLGRGTPLMESACDYRPGRDLVCHVRIGNHRRESKNVPVIRRLIWCVLLSCPGLAEGRMYNPELVCLCFYVAVGRAAVRPELPIYPDRVVVIPYCARKVWAPAPPHRTEVAVCVSGNSWLDA